MKKTGRTVAHRCSKLKKSHLRLLKELLRGEEKRLEAVATIISPHHG